MGERFLILPLDGDQMQKLAPLNASARELSGVVFCEIREGRLECGVLTKLAAAKVRRAIAADAPFPKAPAAQLPTINPTHPCLVP